MGLRSPTYQRIGGPPGLLRFHRGFQNQPAALAQSEPFPSWEASTNLPTACLFVFAVTEGILPLLPSHASRGTLLHGFQRQKRLWDILCHTIRYHTIPCFSAIILNQEECEQCDLSPNHFFRNVVSIPPNPNKFFAQHTKSNKKLPFHL